MLVAPLKPCWQLAQPNHTSSPSCSRTAIAALRLDASWRPSQPNHLESTTTTSTQVVFELQGHGLFVLAVPKLESRSNKGDSSCPCNVVSYLASYVDEWQAVSKAERREIPCLLLQPTDPHPVTTITIPHTNTDARCYQPSNRPWPSPYLD